MTIYVCRDCRLPSRTALMGVASENRTVACRGCGSGRVEEINA